jgi:hypothetical protein
MCVDCADCWLGFPDSLAGSHSELDGWRTRRWLQRSIQNTRFDWLNYVVFAEKSPKNAKKRAKIDGFYIYL